jgi:hypothetical protein
LHDEGVGPREEESLVAVRRPADAVRRCAVVATDLQDLGVAVTVADVVARDDESISDVCLHEESSSADRGR